MINRKLLIAASLVVVMVVIAVNAALDYSLEINYVAVDGELNEAQREEVLLVMRDDFQRFVRLDDIKASIESIRWIHHVEVARQWPDRVRLRVVPERPIAYWNDDSYVNEEGRAFASAHMHIGKLTQLYGPEGKEQLVMQQYQQLTKSLARTGVSLETLRLDERGAWEFTTDRKIRVLLGKEDIKERVQRYLLVMENTDLAGRMDDVEQIDTRYSNGLAVSWKSSPGDLDVAKSENMQREIRL
ncbi:MAG: cell division protein FtsQ/DivIB [Pseudomonadota bacterium]